MTFTTKRLLVGAVAMALTGCYEGEMPLGTAPPAPATPTKTLLPLRLVSSTPKLNEPRAPLTGDITFTLSEGLVKSSIGNDTVQLTPSVAGAGHTGHSMGPGTVNALSSSLISLIGVSDELKNPDCPNLADCLLTPGTSVSGIVQAGDDDRTIIFRPNSQLMPGMTYEIALHGLKLTDGRTVSEHMAPLTFTTANTVATRLVHRDSNITSTMKFDGNSHTVSFYPGQFPLGTDIPANLAPEAVTKHDTPLATATNFISNPVSSITYKPVNTISRFSAAVLDGGSSTIAIATFLGAGANNIWGNSDDLVSSYVENTGNIQKLFISNSASGSPFSERNKTGDRIGFGFSLHDVSVMVYDALDARTLLKHIRYDWRNAKGISDATKQSNATPGEVLTPSAGSVADYHDYRYGTNVTNKGRLLARLRVYPPLDTAAFGSTDAVRYCREYSYNSKGQLVKTTDFSYRTPILIPSGNIEACPTANERRLLLYTITEYDQTTNTTAKIIAKRMGGVSTTEGSSDIEMLVAYFEPR